ncbi:MAG: T9SS type A sorting domain-containing protein [Crocinitomix sp.]|nr:T9SS type A sorting domain-containing protein [Crocinitomix sp.]
MKLSNIALLAAMLGTSFSFAQEFSLVSSSEELITVNHELTESTLDVSPSVYTAIESENYRDFSKSHEIVTLTAGEPAIPFFTESVIVSHYGQVNLLVSHEGYTEYTDVLVAPSKGNLKRNVNPSDIAYTFGTVYSTDAFFPGELATITEPFVLRNTRGVTIIVNPYQYNPVTKTLRIYKNIQAKLETDLSETGINEIELRAENSSTFAQVYENMYLNTNSALGRYTPRDEEGEMLIISANSYMDEMEPFAVWKTQKGIKTTLVSKADVGTSDTDIKEYISDFYDDNPDLVFVILVGDHGQMPCHTYGESGWEELWSDSYYGQMTGDYYPELFVGRFSGNSSEIETMVERTLEYEKTPADGDWMTRAIGLASDEGDGYGDDGEPDWEHARNNREKLMDYGYTVVHEFYDGSHGGEDAAGNPSPAIINPVVDEGIGLFNYTGHGAEDICITGNYSSTEINNAKNNGKYPFVISVACNNGTFTSGTCISEVWLRAKDGGTPTGAIAACGSTILMAWAAPMQTQDEMSDIIAESYVSNRKATLGGIFYNGQMSMLEDYGGSSTAREVMQTWVMFGDPSTLFRNQETMNMTVSHFYNVPLGTASVNVNCDVEDATVAIVQDGVLIGTAKAMGGVATVSFPALTSDQPLLVTATKQNYKPYQGVITVADGPAGINNDAAAFISVYPNPANENFTVNWEGITTPTAIELRDLSGQLVYASNQPNGTSETILTGDLAPGVYLLNVTIDGANNITKLVVQ